jgi:hypothetical protein
MADVSFLLPLGVSNRYAGTLFIDSPAGKFYLDISIPDKCSIEIDPFIGNAHRIKSTTGPPP